MRKQDSVIRNKAAGMTYAELARHIEAMPGRMTKFELVSWLIGYQGKVDFSDWQNIMCAYEDMLID